MISRSSGHGPFAALLFVLVGCNAFDAPTDGDSDPFNRPPTPDSFGGFGAASESGAGGAPPSPPPAGGAGGTLSPTGGAGGTLPPANDPGPAIQPTAYGIDLSTRASAGALGGAGVDRIVPHPDGGFVVAGGEHIEEREGLSVVKVGADGTTQWSRWFETGASRTLGGLIIDNDGAIRIAGTFAGVLDVDGHRVESDEQGRTEILQPLLDAFLMDMDASGRVTRLLSLGGIGDQRSRFLVRRSNGESVLGIEFNGRLDLGSVVLTSSYGALGGNIALVRLSPLGDPIDAPVLPLDSLVECADVFGEDHLILSGRHLHPRSEAEEALGPVWIMKVSIDGDVSWSHAIDPIGFVSPSGIVVDGESILLAASTFASGATFFGEPFGDHGIAIGRLSEGGNVVSSRFYGSRGDLVAAITVLPNHSITVAGAFRDRIDFGGGPLVRKGAEHSSDGFVAVLDRNWEHVFSVSAGSKESDVFTGVARDSAGRVVFTGWTGGGIDLGSGTVLLPHGAFVATIE